MRLLLFLLPLLFLAVFVAVRFAPNGARDNRPSRRAFESPRSAPEPRASSAEEEPLPPGEAGTTESPQSSDPLLGQVIGRIVDEDGAPIQGASIRQMRQTTMFGARTGGTEVVGEETTTDGNGRFAMKRHGLHVYLEARAKGYTHSRTSVISEVGSEIQIPDLVLSPTATLVGAVASARDGQPIQNAQIHIVEKRCLIEGSGRSISYDPGTDVYRCLTDEHGQFEVKGLGELAYMIFVSAEGYADGSVERGVAQSTVAVVLRPADGRIRGTILGPTGERLGGASITASTRPSSGPPHRVIAESSQDGSYQLNGLIDDSYEINVAAIGMAMPVPVRARPDETVDITLYRYGRVEGRVLNADGTPASRFGVAVYSLKGEALSFVRQTERGESPGSFRAFPLHPGRYMLVV